MSEHGDTHTITTTQQDTSTPKVSSTSVRQEVIEIFHAIMKNDDSSHDFLLRVVQPGLAGLMDGSVSTLPPIFVVAFELILIATIRHRYFGTGWLLSIIQVVGGGALVFLAALIFGNA